MNLTYPGRWALTLQVSCSSGFHQLPSTAARGGCWAHLCSCSTQVAGASFQSWLKAVSLKLFSGFCKKKRFAFFTRAPLPQDAAATPSPDGAFPRPILEYKLSQINRTFY